MLERKVRNARQCEGLFQVLTHQHYVQQKPLLSRLPGGGVRLQLAEGRDLGIAAGGYTVLIAWAFLQGATEPAAMQQNDVAGLQVALGYCGAVYFLRDRKKLGLGRSFLYSTAGVALGAVLGQLIASWLRVDIVPLLGMGSPGVLAGEFSLAGLAASAICLA